ncbi:MAG: hypothetical protein AB1486_22100 [Planctomycetota bacterium]
MTATIVPAAGRTPDLAATLLAWSTTGGPPFNTTGFVPTGNPDEYVADIPTQPAGTTISYYIEASDTGGSITRDPVPAPRVLHPFLVTTDTTPCAITHDPPGCALVGAPRPEIVARVTDTHGIASVRIEYSIDWTEQTPVEATRDPGTFVFRAPLPGTVSAGEVIRYRIVALDDSGNGNTATWPWFGRQPVPAAIVPEILLIDLDPTPSSGPQIAAVLDELGIQARTTTQFPGSLTPFPGVIICLGVVPNNTAFTAAQASALKNYIEGGGRVFLEGPNAWSGDAYAGVYRAAFKIEAGSGNGKITGNVTGQSGTFGEGMSFPYAGENLSIDLVNAVLPAQLVFKNGSNGLMVAHSDAIATTIGSSFEIFGLDEGTRPSTARDLVAEILSYVSDQRRGVGPDRPTGRAGGAAAA